MTSAATAGGMTNGARAAQRRPSTARRSTFTRSTLAHGGGTKTAIFTTTARSRASWRITFWTLATTASSSCPSPSIRLTIPGAISAPAILPQRRATARPGTLCTLSTICTKRAFPSFWTGCRRTSARTRTASSTLTARPATNTPTPISASTRAGERVCSTMAAAR